MWQIVWRFRHFPRPINTLLVSRVTRTKFSVGANCGSLCGCPFMNRLVTSYLIREVQIMYLEYAAIRTHVHRVKQDKVENDLSQCSTRSRTCCKTEINLLIVRKGTEQSFIHTVIQSLIHLCNYTRRTDWFISCICFFLYSKSGEI